ncbi:MAG: ABC transporter permease [Burkholderiaceae bacterium]|nr:ABC transporter permease [Burkholderiaceae bacterium]
MPAQLPSLLCALSWPEWRLHAWRHGAVLLAVALGVALAFSVQLINASALSEFASAVRSANGEPDLTLASRDGSGLPDTVLDALALDGAVAVASPVLELDTTARRADTDRAALSVRVTGIDALQVGAVAPALIPRLNEGVDRLGALDPGLVFANATALQRLDAPRDGTLELRTRDGWRHWRLGGTLTLGGAPLLVMDIAAAQAAFGRLGQLSRIDIKLVPGVDAARWIAGQPWLDRVRIARPDDATQRVSNLSRAYRVNLSVLALVALLVGGFLVYSVLALSVAQRTPTFALLGVLGLAAPQRRALVLAEAALLGGAGSVLGLIAGTALAAIALRSLGGDLGGGYFTGVAPQLQWSWAAAALYGTLGIAAAVAGAWWPARAAQALPPAQALKGLSGFGAGRSHWLPGALLLAGAAALALLPAIGGLPLAAYASVAALLAGGVALVPALVQALLTRPLSRHRPLLLLAGERARHQRHTASAAVAGVVASLALSVALTVMVTSFRDAVSVWLDSVLPADLYLRMSGGSAAGDLNTLDASFAAAAAQVPGVSRVRASRVRAVTLDARRPAVALIVRPVDDGANALPWLGDVIAAPAGETGVHVSEPMALAYGLQVGSQFDLPLPDGLQRVRVLGVWRDYARQFGAVVIPPPAWQRHGGDPRLNELALWLAPGADATAVTERVRTLAGSDTPVESASARELRALSLAIFDRSFAVTRYLQVVAIAVGLIGVAASLSAQVLARRKEFGLLAHLGLTRRQVLAIVAGEAAVWLAAGVVLGLLLGVCVSVVLVHVVNPQSFHWTMPLRVPGFQVAALAAAVWLCGVATAALAARRAASRSAVLAVKEDW